MIGHVTHAVADSDQIRDKRGEEAVIHTYIHTYIYRDRIWSSRSWDGRGGGGEVSKKKIFRPFGPQCGLKIGEGGGVGPPGPFPKSSTDMECLLCGWNFTCTVNGLLTSA